MLGRHHREHVTGEFLVQHAGADHDSIDAVDQLVEIVP